MNFNERARYIKLHFLKIGTLNTISFFIKRMFFKKDQQIKIRINKWNHPIYLRNKTSDIAVFYQIFIAEELNFELKKVNQINKIIDLGSNIGLSTIYFQIKFKKCEIICIEPELSNFELLKKNVGFLKCVKLINRGVYSKNTKLYLIDPKTGKDAFYVSELYEENSICEIECVTIHEILKYSNWEYADLIKMDIEGSEREVILDRKIDSWKRITRSLAVEIHDNKQSTEIIKKLHVEFSVNHSGEYTIFENIQSI